MDRNEAISRIKKALKARSGKDWSVKGGKGTAWGWINIDAPPRRRTWHYIQTDSPEPPTPNAIYMGIPSVTPQYRIGNVEDPIRSIDDDPWAREAIENGYPAHFQWEIEDASREFGHMGPADRAELQALLGMAREPHHQGHSIPAANDYYQQHVDMAEGREPSVYGEQYWD